jgi:transcriptional regulator with XRE-family HTH domain
MGADAAGYFSQIGLALIVLREKAGLTARGLAARAGVGKSQLSKYENGRESPKLETLARLLDVLDVEPLAFFYLLQLLHRGASEERLDIELVVSGATKAAAGGGEEAAAFLRVLESLLDLHRAVIKGGSLNAGRDGSAPVQAAAGAPDEAD